MLCFLNRALCKTIKKKPLGNCFLSGFFLLSILLAVIIVLYSLCFSVVFLIYNKVYNYFLQLSFFSAFGSSSIFMLFLIIKFAISERCNSLLVLSIKYAPISFKANWGLLKYGVCQLFTSYIALVNIIFSY